ncbi:MULTISPECIES: TetR/AcrR family transcriptional regulator [Sphingopyxis]|uniref:TetR/AcrR family transcriptional regulator n=1 Tax=Sphingopyxis TaxID=165697 RepID=UPI0012E3ECB7|nr:MULTISPECIES: TetR/AcrR family transcriptional regulator [Sphingopyxis]
MTDNLQAAGASRVPQGERSRKMRARILAAAIELLREKGYSAFRVADVADAAGVSRGAQLHHFPTKDLLVAACLEQVFAVALERASEAAGRAADDDRILEAACEDAEAFFYGEDFLIALDLVISGNKLRALADDVRGMSKRRRVGAEQAWVRRFARTGISPSDAEDILWLMWSVIRGLAIRNQIGRDPERSKRVTRMTIDLLSEYTGKLRKQPAHGEGPGEAG